MRVIVFVLVGFGLGMGAGNAIDLGALSIVPAVVGGLFGFWTEAFLFRQGEYREYRSRRDY